MMGNLELISPARVKDGTFPPMQCLPSHLLLGGVCRLSMQKSDLDAFLHHAKVYFLPWLGAVGGLIAPYVPSGLYSTVSLYSTSVKALVPLWRLRWSRNVSTDRQETTLMCVVISNWHTRVLTHIHAHTHVLLGTVFMFKKRLLNWNHACSI